MNDVLDPKGLIREAYRIEGIGIEECRTIFLAWALSIEGAIAAEAAVSELLSRHSSEPDDHPMTAILKEGLTPSPSQRRRGGRAARIS